MKQKEDKERARVETRPNGKSRDVLELLSVYPKPTPTQPRLTKYSSEIAKYSVNLGKPAKRSPYRNFHLIG